MSKQQHRELNVEEPTIGIGCLTSFAVFIGNFVLIWFLVNTFGGARGAPGGMVGLAPGVKLIYFILNLLGYALIGYVTARFARRSKIFNAALVGCLNMAFGFGSIALSGVEHLDAGTIVRWALNLPLMLLGAWWAASAEEVGPGDSLEGSTTRAPGPKQT
jgi:hypothetical protein